MRRARGALLAAAVAAALATGAPAARACAFHAWLPELTLVDRLLDADRIVLARPDPASPFRFAAVETLPALHEAAAPPEPIPFLVDSVARRRLGTRPGESVLLAHDPIDEVWRRLAHVTPDLRAVLDRLLAEAPGWETPMDPARFRIAAELLDHADPALRRLALRELDRAPYGTLRRLGLRPDAGALLEALRAPAPEARPYVPIRVLLLGFSGDPRALRVLDETLRAVAQGGSAPTGLGAYVVARVEIDGPEGVDRVVGLLLGGRPGPEASPATRRRDEQVLEALAIQAQAAEPEVRHRIFGTLGETLATRPDLAAPAARHFGARELWDLRPAIGRLVRERRIASVSDMFVAANYLALAEPGARRTP